MWEEILDVLSTNESLLFFNAYHEPLMYLRWIVNDLRWFPK